MKLGRKKYVIFSFKLVLLVGLVHLMYWIAYFDLARPLHMNREDERSCKLPRMNPTDPVAIKLIQAQTMWEKLKGPQCITNPSFKFKSDSDSKLIKLREFRTEAFWMSTNSCCYLPFTTDSKYKLKNLTRCIEITEDETEVPIVYSDINVLCYGKNGELTYRDYFHFFRLDSVIEKRLQVKEDSTRSDGSDHLSLIFLGLETVSLTNFQRLLPRTRDYLLKNMSALEFIGLNKVGYGTLENLVPALSGCPYVNGKTVFPSDKEDCHLIWEKFKEKGYRTVLSEEEFWFLVYKQVKHENNGTHNMDYTNLPFVKGIQSKCPYAASKFGCFEHQFAPSMISDRVVQISSKLQGKLYYHHTWTSQASHDIIEYAKYLDEPYYKLLRTLNEKELLNQTLVIVYSDHGSLFSDYSRTVDGLIEARHPLLYMVFPTWFQFKYSEAMKNLKLNTQSLISPFDVYQTLVELLELNRVLNSTLKTQEEPNTTTTHKKCCNPIRMSSDKR